MPQPNPRVLTGPTKQTIKDQIQAWRAQAQILPGIWISGSWTVDQQRPRHPDDPRPLEDITEKMGPFLVLSMGDTFTTLDAAGPANIHQVFLDQGSDVRVILQDRELSSPLDMPSEETP